MMVELGFKFCADPNFQPGGQGREGDGRKGGGRKGGHE